MSDILNFQTYNIYIREKTPFLFRLWPLFGSGYGFYSSHEFQH